MVIVEITNLPEFKEELQAYLDKKMWVFGQLLVTEIQNKIEEIPLFGTGEFWRGIHSYIDPEGNLKIEDTVHYGKYLEFGTYTYWDIFGMERYTKPIHPKKKDMTPRQKLGYPKGMQPFAPFRRVLWNPILMKDKLAEALE